MNDPTNSMEPTEDPKEPATRNEAVYANPAEIFASCGKPYVTFRRRHDPTVVDYLTHLAPTPARVLDLGCGPGTLALDLAESGMRITAVDASQEMLNEGRTWAKRRGVSHAIEWRCADAATLGQVDRLGTFDGAVIADAFHWLDRPRVLRALDTVVRPGGFVAVVGYRAPQTQREWWHPLLVKLREKHLGAADLAGPSTPYIRPEVGHEAMVRASPFNRVSVLRADYRRVYTLDELVGLQRTFAYSSSATLGERQEAFEADVRSTLSVLQPNGLFAATLQAAVIVGRRPESR
ncbi:class I SAM-dependent methyltransferase [Streptomyces sp. NBC_00638]|uniref:class I SAM-dependent methyltransferase n=1 Tax=Streptomyces sp. NBC_00638 TaxID=2975794 RepID=UPI00225A283F|nr:class I SAM-dependent methyltransferase [Streptomyces sp. NBC_00638]MCX5009148.1 class I SAM-dependent methyltransferase [Streptomyces sp. NBC_00638]